MFELYITEQVFTASCTNQLYTSPDFAIYSVSFSFKPRIYYAIIQVIEPCTYTSRALGKKKYALYFIIYEQPFMLIKYFINNYPLWGENIFDICF